jgi:hypothetical protein
MDWTKSCRNWIYEKGIEIKYRFIAMSGKSLHILGLIIIWAGIAILLSIYFNLLPQQAIPSIRAFSKAGYRFFSIYTIYAILGLLIILAFKLNIKFQLIKRRIKPWFYAE